MPPTQVYKTIETMHQLLTGALDCGEQARVKLVALQHKVVVSIKEQQALNCNVEELEGRKKELESSLQLLAHDKVVKTEAATLESDKTALLESERATLEEHIRVLTAEVITATTAAEKARAIAAGEEAALKNVTVVSEELMSVICERRGVIGKLSDEKQALLVDVSVLKGEIKEKVMLKNAATASFDTLVHDTLVHKRNVASSAVQCTAAAAALQKMGSETAEQRATLKAVLADVAKAQEERRQVDDELERAQGVSGSREVLCARVEELESELVKFRSGRADYVEGQQSQLAQIEAKNVALKQTLRSRDDQIHANVAASDQLHETVFALRNEAEMLTTRLSTSEREQLDLRSGAKTADQLREVEIDGVHAALEAEREMHYAETSQWRAQRGELESEVAAVRIEMDELIETIAALRTRDDTAAKETVRHRTKYEEASADAAAHIHRIRDLEAGIARGADTIASLEATIDTLHSQLERNTGAYMDHAAAASAEDFARQINSGHVGLGSLALLQWHDPRKRWRVVNCPDVHLAHEIEAQLALDKDRLHLVRVIFRDDRGALTVTAPLR